MKTLNEKLVDAYQDVVYKKDDVSEAPISDKHGSVMGSSAEAVLFINKVNNMLKKREPHWPDIVMNLKKAQATLQKAQKAAGK
jgi:flagellar hook-basal body complex protein FliE